MKRTKCFFVLIAAMMILLSSCRQAASISKPVQDTTQNDQDSMTNVWQSAAWFDLEPITVEHGEDAVIDWNDPGMEALIRLYLDRPEGDIYRSDVWDIQVLHLCTMTAPAYVKVMMQPLDGSDSFGMDELVGNADCYSFVAQDMPAIKSLEDLQYFDSLQVFSLLPRSSDKMPTDFSGIERCRSLRAVHLRNCRPENLVPFAALDKLENLWLDNCGILDLTPLENMPVLNALSLRSDELISLEPLTTLKNLNYLALGSESIYPSLEPLTKTTIRYLDMTLSISGRKNQQVNDYSPLTRMSTLVYLTLTNHVAVDIDLCAKILNSNKELKYLDISYTTAADQQSDSGVTLDTSQLAAFVNIPC